MKKLFVVYHYFAHYRMPVIKALVSSSGKVEPTFISDLSSNEPSLLTLDSSSINNFKKVENIWLGKWLWQKGLIKFLLKNKPEYTIFLGQFSFLTTWIGTLLLKLLGKKVYFWGHGLYGNEKGIKRVFRNFFNKLPDKHLVYGHHAKSLLVAEGIKDSDIVVIYNSLDYKQHKLILDNLRTSLNVSQSIKKSIFPDYFEHPMAFFIGRLTPVKKLEMVIQALSVLKSNNKILNFLIIGDGPQYDFLKNLVTSLNLTSQVCFYGACHEEKVIGELIYSADFCISPGNVGLTAIHSLSYGTPVITHDKFELQMPEFEAIKPDFNGDFFEYDNLTSLVSIMEKWMFKVTFESESIFINSISIIDECYNPEAQARLILNSLN
ncbi:glycosyltransferase [Shewanella baltica]|uniref:glycosyltransferase n=1 Tax=Shewanella baltica TaxID=62322 RepID=UPI003D7A62CE